MTVTDLLITGAEKLEGVTTLPLLDAEVLLAFILEKNRAYVIAHGSDTIGIVQERQYYNLIGRRAAGEPIAYITGHKEFYGLDFRVDDRVLVPRPETEKIVDIVVKAVKERYGTSEHPRILEVGTGSGCIAVAVSHQVNNQAHIMAIDLSLDALDVAIENARTHNAEIQFLHGSVYGPLPEGIAPFDIIISNPPYLNADNITFDSPETASLAVEPPEALFAHDDGFAVIAEIIQGAATWLLPYGILVLEIGDNHTKRITDLGATALPTHRVEILPEFSGKSRIAVFWPTTK